MKEHLSDQQFAESLMQPASGEAAAHLEHCERCRREADALRATLSELRTAAVHWSESRAPQQTALRLAESRTRHFARAVFASLLLAVAAPGGVYLAVRHHADEARVAKAKAIQHGETEAGLGRLGVADSAGVAGENRNQGQSSTPDSAQDIAQDNNLLLAVNRELAEPVAPAMQPLLTTEQSTRAEQARRADEQKAESVPE